MIYNTAGVSKTITEASKKKKKQNTEEFSYHLNTKSCLQDILDSNCGIPFVKDFCIFMLQHVFTKNNNHLFAMSHICAFAFVSSLLQIPFPANLAPLISANQFIESC
jgi:hypothetical protein